MPDEHSTRSNGYSGHTHPIEPYNSSVPVATSEHNEPVIHRPVPMHPRLPIRKSSGPLVIPCHGSAVGSLEPHLGPSDVKAISQRRSSKDIDKLGKEAREELRRHATALQESLTTIFSRVEAVRQEHDKLDSNNKLLQKFIGDLMSTSKVTASGSLW